MTAWKYVGTSWKMNKTRPEAVTWVNEVIKDMPPLHTDQRVFVMPPFTALDAVTQATVNSSLLVGAQNVHDAESGAHTGEVSAAMLAELGCDLVEIGHSERRQYYNETDAAVSRKVRRVLQHGMTPLVCVGETAYQHKAGTSIDHVLQQATHAYGELDTANQAKCLLAYEPVWAIGKGALPATPTQIGSVHQALREEFPATTVIYGGSVNASNAASLVSTPDVDGLFIGRAALHASDFLAVLAAVLDEKI